MARQQSTTGGKRGGGGKKWTPPPQQQTDQAFAEVDLSAAKDSVQRIPDDHREDADLPPNEDADEPSRSERFLERSQGVRKRITRMTRQFSQQMADQEARFQRQLADLKQQNDRLRVQRNSPDVDEAAHNAKITALQNDLAAAYESGDTKKQAEITTKIAQLQGAFESAKRAALMGRERSDDRGTDDPNAARRPADNREGGPTREARKWMRSNREWWDDPEFAVEKQAAIIFDNELMDDGSDPNDPEHYDEMSEMLVKKFPHMKEFLMAPGERRRARDDDDDDFDDEEDADDLDTRASRGNQRGRRERRPPVPAFNGRSAERGNQPARRGRTVTLSREQRANMITFGLDPNNDDHVREYAKSAEETGSSYARGGR
jgi:hypothetical protein